MSLTINSNMNTNYVNGATGTTVTVDGGIEAVPRHICLHRSST